jgi:hypothetical protein
MRRSDGRGVVWRECKLGWSLIPIIYANKPLSPLGGAGACGVISLVSRIGGCSESRHC